MIATTFGFTDPVECPACGERDRRALAYIHACPACGWSCCSTCSTCGEPLRAFLRFCVVCEMSGPPRSAQRGLEPVGATV
jgi:hypothetical protein